MKRFSAGFLPPIAVDVDAPSPIYQQVSNRFRRMIVEGKLRPGQRIPSTRQLAHELKVSRIPILSAYEQLHAEGYLETFVGAGTCVARSIPGDLLKLRSANAPIASGRNTARRISNRVAATRTPAMPWLQNLGAFRVGVPALQEFPTGLWARMVNRHSRKTPVELMSYGDSMGYLPFREVIAEYLGAYRAVRCDPSQILVTTGSQQGLQICAQVLLNPGDRVWLEEPGYPGAYQALMSVGANIVPIPVDQDGLDISKAIHGRKNARAVYITPSHQFPLGMTMSATRRMQLLNWATQNSAWIIEDDYDSEFRFGGRPIVSLQGLDANARVIYAGTFSKVLFPALRLGYLVVPEDLVSAFAATRDAIDTFPSTLYQLVVTDFIREGHFSRHIRRMRMLYMERRAALVEAINKHMPSHLEVIGAEIGMQLTALLPSESNDVVISRRAAQKGISVRPLSMCYLKPPTRGGFILGYGSVTPYDIDDGVRRLNTVL